MTDEEMETNLADLARWATEAYPKEDPEMLAKVLWDEVTVRPDALDVLRPAFTNYVKGVWRSEVRAVEARVFDEKTDTVATSAVKDLVSEGFRVGGRWVLWGDATRDDLAEKIAEYGGQIFALSQSCGRYEKALQQMTEAGVDRYGDLFKRGRK